VVVATTVTAIRFAFFDVTAWICRTCSSSAQTVSTAVVPLTATANLRQRASRTVSSPAYRAAVTGRRRGTQAGGAGAVHGPGWLKGQQAFF